MTAPTKLLLAAIMLLPGGLLMAPLLWLARRREARLARLAGQSDTTHAAA